MGSYGFLNDLDIKTSYDFLLELINNNLLDKERVLDCGSGMG
jgi:hypothetical protein